MVLNYLSRNIIFINIIIIIIDATQTLGNTRFSKLTVVGYTLLHRVKKLK